MNESFDSVENINQFVNPDKVKPTHQSERDKDRKFSRALKEQMEEDLEKKKKRKSQDSFVLGDNPGDEDDADGPEEEPRPANEDKGTEAAEPNREVKQDKDHIDLKA